MGERADGRFELYYDHGWAVLTVYPSDGDGRPVYHEDVENRMRILGVPRVGSASIRQVVRDAAGQPVRLVEWPDGQRLASVVSVTVAPDEMSASLEVTAPRKGAAPPRADDLEAALRDAGVSHGVDRAALTSLLADARYGESVQVAAGSPPVHARSAEIDYHFDPDRGRPYLVMEFDRINLRELKFIENKKAGDLLAELVPPVEPRNGMTVTGRVLVAETTAEPIQLAAGANTELSEDGTKIHATEDGNVRLTDGAVVVEPVITVTSVNYETGNIRFEGSVVVEKDVADGFTIEANGDVEIGRGVGRAVIKAGGNVLLRTGINGNGDGRIECEGNLLAKYVESSAVISHHNVIVEEAIMHSHVTAWKHCALVGRRGEIIASNIVVGGSLWCKKLGSVAEARTVVSIGVAPDLLGRFRDSRTELDAAERRFDELQRQLEQISRAITEGNTEARLQDALAELNTEFSELRISLPDLRHRVHELREHLEASRESRLVVEDTMFKGAVVLFGTSEFHAPDRGARKTVLRRGVDGILAEGFNPAEQPKPEFDAETRGVVSPEA